MAKRTDSVKVLADAQQELQAAIAHSTSPDLTERLTQALDRVQLAQKTIFRVTP